MGPIRVSLLAVAFAAAAAACGSSGDGSDELLTVRANAEHMVAGPVAEQTGLGDLRPTCDEVLNPAVGATFQCSAITEDENLIWLNGVIDERGHIDLVTTNVITADALPSFEAAAVAALNRSVGASLDADAVDCGDRSVVVLNDTLLCAVRDPSSDEVFDVTFTMTDIEARQFSLAVGDTARG